MITETQPFGAIELSLDESEKKWPAEIEAQGTDHLRVRLIPNESELPRLATGMLIHCSMGDATGSFSAEARVLSQSGPTVWLNVDPQWRKGGRRKHARVPAGFCVSFEVGQTTGIGLCLNLSSGGLRLRVGEELAYDAPIRLIFRLPHQSKPVQVGARVLYQREVGDPDPRLEAGLKFVELPLGEATRIAAFCNS